MGCGSSSSRSSVVVPVDDAADGGDLTSRKVFEGLFQPRTLEPSSAFLDRESDAAALEDTKSAERALLLSSKGPGGDEDVRVACLAESKLRFCVTNASDLALFATFWTTKKIEAGGVVFHQGDTPVGDMFVVFQGSVEVHMSAPDGTGAGGWEQQQESRDAVVSRLLRASRVFHDKRASHSQFLKPDVLAVKARGDVLGEEAFTRHFAARTTTAFCIRPAVLLALSPANFAAFLDAYEKKKKTEAAAATIAMATTATATWNSDDTGSIALPLPPPPTSTARTTITSSSLSLSSPSSTSSPPSSLVCAALHDVLTGFAESMLLGLRFIQQQPQEEQTGGGGGEGLPLWTTIRLIAPFAALRALLPDQVLAVEGETGRGSRSLQASHAAGRGTRGLQAAAAAAAAAASAVTGAVAVASASAADAWRRGGIPNLGHICSTLCGFFLGCWFWHQRRRQRQGQRQRW
jgi:CRP-like cAMP-binding protein